MKMKPSALLPASMYPPSTARLRKAIERRETVRHWGHDYEVTPRLVNTVFGDGRQLIYLNALNTRPAYYAVRIDSGWSTSNYDDDAFIDHLEDVQEAIEEQFGSADHYEDGEELEFPVASFENGCCWGELHWPVEVLRKRYRRRMPQNG